MSDEAILEAAGLRLRFQRVGDRIAHTIEQRVETAQRPDSAVELVSVEGTSDDDWPSSPPFQSVHVEQRPNGEQVALLVGMAGTSYWSASVQLEPSGKLTWDVACRVKAAPRTLGSTYERRGLWLPRPIDAVLDVVAPQQQFIIRPVQPWTFPTTLRWRYELLPT